MAQILRRDGSDAPATEVITVADLLSRNAPAPLREGEPDTDGISVGALLRREGRAPGAADHPRQPRPRRQEAAPDDDGRPDRRVLVRRGAIAAGTLLAAGSVLGATLFTDVVPTVNQAPAPGGEDDGGAYPGQGLLDPEGPVDAPADPVVIDQAAASDPLDPGTAAPTDWVPVAFPGALAGSNTGADDGTAADDSAATDDGGNSSGSGESSRDDDSSTATTVDDDDDDDTTDGSSDDNGSSGNSGSGSGSDDSGSDDSGSGSGSDDSGSSDDDNDEDDDKGLVGGLVDTVGGVLGLGGDDDRDSDDGDSDEDDERSSSARLFSAESDEDEEDSSAPQDEDDSESGDDEDDEGDSDGSSDDGDGGGLIGGLLGTVGGLLR